MARARMIRLVLAATAMITALTAAATGCASAGEPRQGVYVSIGDSYAAGFQSDGQNTAVATRNGFSDKIVQRVAAAGGNLRLLNFGCGGATSNSLMNVEGCAAPAMDAPAYPDRTQAAAAVEALTANRGQVRLVTVVIGGNDIARCVRAGNAARAFTLTCVDSAMKSVRANLDSLLTRIREVVGPDVPVVGLTYPDMFLGAYVRGDKALAERSVEVFRDWLNPALRTEYTEAGALFADITEATGGYGSFAQTTELAAYGSLPVPVARACTVTNYCAAGDLHPTDAGATEIADAVLRLTPDLVSAN